MDTLEGRNFDKSPDQLQRPRQNNDADPSSSICKSDPKFVETSLKSVSEYTMKHGTDKVAQIFLSNKNNGFKALHLACLRNKISDVEAELESGSSSIDITLSKDSTDWPGFTPLHFAVLYRHEKIVDILLKNGANILITDCRNMTPLCYAVSKRSESMLKLIVPKLISNNILTVNGLPLLHVMSMLRDSSIAQQFLPNQLLHQLNTRAYTDSQCYLNEHEYPCLRKKKNVNAHSIPEWLDFTPLHIAARYNRIEMAKLLLSCGARVDIFTSVSLGSWGIANGVSALHVAHRYGNKRIMDLILSHHDGKTNATDANGLSQLHIACSRRDPNFVQKFLDHGYSIISMLTVAMRYNRTNVVKLLVKRGEAGFKYLRLGLKLNNRSHKMIDQLMNEKLIKRSDAAYILQQACVWGRFKSVKLLIERGTDLNFYSQEVPAPLYLAIIHRHEKIVEILLDHGANPFCVDFVKTDALELLVTNKTISHLVLKENVYRYYHTVVLWLMKAGMDIKHLNRALRLCVENETATQVLLQFGADINALGRNGKTVLYHYFAGSSCFGDNWNNYIIFRDHLQKLNAIGLYVSEANESLFERVKQKYERLNVTGSISEQCKSECEKLENTKFNEDVSLRDVIFKNVKQMTAFCKNERFKEILKSKDFDSAYPMYGSMLKLQYVRGCIRSCMLEVTRESLKTLTNWNLPDLCFLEIFNYLSVENKKTLMKAGGKQQLYVRMCSFCLKDIT
ncbi:hypothetical protein QAD02_006212 [Eretmocerus hayati]|uniref:Uncharacterized protein n=1 Tax=Eretmocerus hayati TaxID=131215 RepID=A0ACC2N0B3_9HYME|nr:hypothetical protein QAD02_006212 [Eretmocerus hayati]